MTKRVFGWFSRIFGAAPLAAALVLFAALAPGEAGAVAKPNAVWNGDFVNATTRGDFKFYQSGTSYATANSIENGVGIVKGQGFVFKREAGKLNFPVSAVAGISRAAYSTEGIRCLMSYWGSNGSDQNPRYGVSLSTDNYYVGSYNSTMQFTTGNWGIKSSSTSTLEDTDDIHYLALSHVRDSSAVGGTRTYLDGVEVYAASGLQDSADDKGYQAITVGGLYCSANNRLPDMKMHYLAILAGTGSAADIKYWSLTDMTSAETVADAGTITGGAAVGVNLNTSGMTATLSGATSAAAVFVQENATLKLTNGSSLTVGGGTGPLYIADGKTLTIDASELTLSATNPQAFIAAKVFGTSQIIVAGLSNPDGRIEQSVTEDGVYLTYVSKTASFAMGVDDGLTGTYVTLTEQLAFDGITLQQFHDGGYTLRGRFAGGSIDNSGVLVTGYNPVVTDDGNGNVTSIRYEMQGLNNQIKCVIVTLTPNAGNTGINVSATPVSVEGGTSAALYVETGTVGNAFLSGDAAVSGVRRGTFGTSYGQNGCYCLYYLHIVGKHVETVAIDGNRSLTVGTDLATAYDKLTLSGTGVATLAGSHLTANRLALEGGVTLDTASMGAIGGLTEISVGSGCKVILHPGADLQATLSGAGTVEFASGSTRIASGNTGLTGNIVVKSGATIKAGNGTSFGPMTSDGYTSRRVIVEDGGVADVNKQTIEASFRISGDGTGDGALINSGSDVGDNYRQIYVIEVAANASVGGSGQFGIIRHRNGAAYIKFLAEGLTLTKKGTGTFLLSQVSRDTSGYNGTIEVTGGQLKIMGNNCNMSDGITLTFNGGSLTGNKTLSVDTLNIESGSPCNSFNQALTIGTLNVNNGNFGRNATTTVTTMNVGSGGTGVYNGFNKPATMTVAEGGELNFQNYGNSVFDLSSATISGAGTVKLLAGAFTFADATLAGFSGNLVMAGGTARLDTAGFTDKGGVTATGTAAITATGATMPLDLRDVASSATLTLTGAQVNVGTNRPQGAIVMADGESLGTSTLEATFAGPGGAAEASIVLNVTGDLTEANVTAYKPGGTAVEPNVTKTFDATAGTLTIALRQIAIAADAGYVDFSTLTVPESGTVAITTDHPVTLALSANDVTSLSTRTDKINLVASGTGSFRLLLPDPSLTPQNVLDTLPFAGDFEIMYDLATFDATALTTAIAVPADATVAFTNSSDSVVEYTGALTVGAGAAVNTYADMTLSNAANSFGEEASLGVLLGSATVAFAPASAPSAVTVAADAVLALSNTAITGNIAFSGTGILRLLGDLEVAGNVSFESAITLAFADGASLTATGDGTESGCVLANAAVTLAPDSQTAASGALLSAEAITAIPPFATTAPSDGNTYVFETTSTAVTFTRTPNAAFSYDVAIGAVASSGWVASWGGATTMQSLRIGPNAAYSVVPEIVKNAFEPWYDLPARTGSFSFSVWADVSKMLEVTDGGADGKRMMLSVGDQAAAAILYREGDYVKFANVVGGTPLGIAQLSVPNDAEFHLYTAVCDFDNKTMSLYIDGGAGGQSATGETLSAVTLNSGIQVGSVFCHDNQALPGSFWCGTKMALAAVRGYNKAISAGEVANIALNFPVGGSSFARSVTISQNDTTVFTGYNNTMPVGYTLELRRGVFNIPAGYEFSVPILRTLNLQGNPTMSANIDGTLRISGSSGKDPWSTREGSNPGGIVFGEWTGTGVYTVSSTGSIVADDAYLMTIKSAGTQTINVNGGTIDVKGLWAANAGSSITVKDNGTLCVKEIQSDGGAITKNLKWSTFKIKADATETRAINFSAVSGYATTLDPNGHTLTLAAEAVTGAGDITVGTSANPKGKVVFQGNGNYTGSLIVNSANKDMIEFSPVNAWTGNVKYTVGGAMGQNFNGYAGTLTIDGAITVDARGIDLSAATVVLSNGATLLADAGKEAKTGGITVNTGTTLKLYVSEDVYNYEGHVFVGSPAGTLEYRRVENETDVQITDTNVLVGNNLLPYYQTWEVESGTGSGVVNLAENWRRNTVPTERTDGTYGNAAFHVTGGSEITVTVDATIPFGEIQVYGEGTVTFVPSGDNYLSASVLSISDGVTVRLAGGEPLKVSNGFVQGGTKLVVASGAALSLDGVSCKTKLQVDGALTTRGVCDLATGVYNIFNSGSTFTVASGTNTVMTEEKAFKGAIVVSAGATLVNARPSDAIDYTATDENPATVEVYGILSMGTTRWSLGSYNTITLHEGAQVTGTGDADNGALDWIENATSTLVADGNASIASKLRVRGGANVTFNITDGKALTHTGGWTGVGTATIPNGQLISTAVPTCTANISSGATFTLKDCAWTSGDVFRGEGTLELQTAGTTRNMSAASSFGGTLKVTKNGNGWSVFTATAPQFANRPKLIVGGSSAGMVLDEDFVGGESKAFTVKNLEGLGTISSKNGAAAGNRFIDTLQTENTVFSGNFEAGGSGGAGNRNSALIVRGPDVLDGEVKWLKLTGANTSLGDLLVKNNAKVIFEGSGSWSSGTVTVEDGGCLDLTAKQDAVATLVLNAGSTLMVDTTAIPSVATLTLPANGVVNIETAATPVAANTPLLKVTGGGIEAGANLGLFTVNGQQCVVTAVATDGGVNIVYGGDRDDTWDTAATDWTSTTFDTGATYVDGMNVTFGPMEGEVAEHTVTLDGTRAPDDVVFKAGTAWTLTGGTFNPTGTVTLEPGAVVTIESTATGTYSVGAGATLSLTNATVTSVSGAGTLNIPAGATVALDSASAIDSIAALTGEGTLALPANTSPTAALQILLQNDSNWHGTVVITDLTGNVERFVNNWGNANSKVMLKSVQGYFPNNTTVNAEVIFENGSNGYAYDILNSWSGTTTFRKISGTGLIRDTTTGKTSVHPHVFRDASGFTGSIEKTANRRIFFSASRETGFPDVNGIIYVDNDGTAKIGDGNFWKADVGGIRIAGTVEFLGAAMFSSATTLDGGAVLKFDDIGTAEAPKVLAVNAAVATSAASSDTAIVKIGFGDDIDFGERSSITLATWSSIASNISFSFVNETMEIEWSLVPGETSLVMKKNPEIKNDKGETVGYMMSTAAVVLDTSADVILPEDSVVTTVQLFGMDVPTLVVKGAALNAAVIAALDADGRNQDGSMVMTGFTVTPDTVNKTTTISLNSPAVESAPVTVSEVVYPPMSMAASGAPVFAVSSSAGLWYGIEYSTDGENWTLDATSLQRATGLSTVLTGGEACAIPSETAGGPRFFRIAVGGSKAAFTMKSE